MINKSKKKVSIINFACADNFGAVLQAYALEYVIQEKDFIVETINFKPKYIMGQYSSFNNLGVVIKKLRLKSALKKIFLGFRNYKNENNRRQCFEMFREANMNLSKNVFYSSNDLIKGDLDYDFFITGSDQVWNPVFKKHIGNSYLLDFAPECKIKIAYAASIGEDIEDSMKTDYKKLLNRFDFISLREKSSVPFIESITNKEIKVSLDPTLLLNKADWKTVLKKPTISEKFILVYDLEFNREVIDIANQISSSLGYKVISYSNKRNFRNSLKSFKYEGPSELLGYIEKAQFILTNSFHGTVFSVIFQKQFYTIPHTTRGLRMVDFLNSIGLNNRLIHNSSMLELESLIDYRTTIINLETLKMESVDFLFNSLNFDLDY